MRVYVNGALVDTGAADSRLMDSFNVVPYIGAAGASDCVWNGAIAEVAVYPAALGVTRIAAHYAARF